MTRDGKRELAKMEREVGRVTETGEMDDEDRRWKWTKTADRKIHL